MSIIQLPKFLFGLNLIKDQWLRACLALLASFVILILDFLLTIGMPKIIKGLELVLVKGDLSIATFDTVILTLLVIIRPVLGWLVNFFQINVVLTILRNLEDKVASKAYVDWQDNIDFSEEKFANMLISHGRYYVDNYLIPLFRAVTDIGSVIVISVGLALQFPMPLALFIGIITILLVCYQSVVSGFLINNGKLLLNSYEKIITLAQKGFSEKISGQDSNFVLDEKKKSSLILGSISQGLKYIIEFSFMFSFGVVSLYVILVSPDIFVIFVSTFAYAGVRMLPLFTSIIAFTQGKDSASHPINELSQLLNFR